VESTTSIIEQKAQPMTMYGLRRYPKIGQQSLIAPKKNLKDQGIVMITPEVEYT